MQPLLRLHRQVALSGPKQPGEWLLFALLWPLSLLYGLVASVRGLCYDRHWLSSYKAEVPVVSVGNLAVGGTGKTPVVDWLVKDFQRQGKKVAIVSRGYGGNFSGRVGFVSKGQGSLMSAGQAGDEPYLLACRNPQAAVLIARQRAAGVKAAIKRTAAEVVILDDGFQHRAVARDLDLVLLDGTSPLGNKWPLPAGLLREFPFALQRADLLLLTRSPRCDRFTALGKPIFSSQHQLSAVIRSLDGQPFPLSDLNGKKIYAFAGIADPGGFFASLHQAGLHLDGSLGLGDHCRYDSELVQRINRFAAGADALVTTEKDAVKLSAAQFELPCYQLPMELVINDQAAFSAVLQEKLWSEQ